MCLSKMFSFIRRSKNSKHVPDGYGMENMLYAESFSVSRSGDSYAQQNFCISVDRTDNGYTAKGVLLDADGTEYNAEEYIRLSKSACKAMAELRPERLRDVAVNTEISAIDEVQVLDAPNIEIEVRYTDGSLHQKVDSDDFSVKVYEIVLPCFRKKLR